MDDVTALRDALLAKHIKHTDWCYTEDGITDCNCLMVERGDRMRADLDSLIAAAARRAIEGSGVVEALRFLSTYEKDPPEVMYDQWAYDRLLSFVHDVAARALPRPDEPRVERCAFVHSPGVACKRPASVHGSIAGEPPAIAHPFTPPAPDPTGTRPTRLGRGGAGYMNRPTRKVREG